MNTFYFAFWKCFIYNPIIWWPKKYIYFGVQCYKIGFVKNNYRVYMNTMLNCYVNVYIAYIGIYVYNMHANVDERIGWIL